MEHNAIAAAYQEHPVDMPGRDEAIEEAVRGIHAGSRQLRDQADRLFAKSIDPRIVERVRRAFEGKENVDCTSLFTATGEHLVTMKLESRKQEYTAANDMVTLRELTNKRAEALARLQNAARQLDSGKNLEERRVQALNRVQEAAAARARALAIEQQRVQERLRARVRQLAEQREQQLQLTQERVREHERARAEQEPERTLDPNSAPIQGRNDGWAREVARLLKVIEEQQAVRDLEQLRDRLRLNELELSKLRALEQALDRAPTRIMELGKNVPVRELEKEGREQEPALEGREGEQTPEQELARLLERGLATDGPELTVEQELGQLHQLGLALEPELTRDLAEDFGRLLDPDLVREFGLEGPARDAISLSLDAPERELGQLMWSTREASRIHVMEVMSLDQVMGRLAREHDFFRELRELNRHIDEQEAERARQMGHEIAPDPGLDRERAL
jgi:hypothetical protein